MCNHEFGATPDCVIMMNVFLREDHVLEHWTISLKSQCLGSRLDDVNKVSYLGTSYNAQSKKIQSHWYDDIYTEGIKR